MMADKMTKCNLCKGTGDKLLRPRVPRSSKQQCPTCRGEGSVLDLSEYQKWVDGPGITLAVYLKLEDPHEGIEENGVAKTDTTTHSSPPRKKEEYFIGEYEVSRRVFDGVLTMVRKATS